MELSLKVHNLKQNINQICINLLRFLVKLLLRLRLQWVVGVALSFFLTRLAGPKNAVDSKGTLLALGQPFRFRGDVEQLGAMGFRVLAVPWKIYAGLSTVFWESDFGQLYMQKRSFADKKMFSVHARTRDLLKSVANVIKTTHGINCVISAALHYRQDVDWGVGFKHAGIPYVVMHRENTSVASIATNEFKITQWLEMQPFEGDLLIVHGHEMLEALLQAGYAEPKQLLALGAMRMDKLIFLRADTGNRKLVLGGRPHITFFSFHLGSGLGMSLRRRLEPGVGAGFDELFSSVHGAIGEFAKENPEVDITVKAKWGGDWEEALNRVLKEKGIRRDDIPNLNFDCHTDAHELILKSHAVVAFQSTTALEAGVLGRQVVWPDYAEAKSKFKDHIFFRNAGLHDVFLYVESPGELKNALSQLIIDPDLWDEARFRKFENLFERYIGPLDGKITERYASVIDNVIKKRRSSLN